MGRSRTSRGTCAHVDCSETAHLYRCNANAIPFPLGRKSKAHQGDQDVFFCDLHGTPVEFDSKKYDCKLSIWKKEKLGRNVCVSCYIILKRRNKHPTISTVGGKLEYSKDVNGFVRII